ncbi:hypothetical protein GYH30_002705 [Glycine max]|nr:hypothetical protein GYH30_002705 [Glycine max]
MVFSSYSLGGARPNPAKDVSAPARVPPKPEAEALTVMIRELARPSIILTYASRTHSTIFFGDGIFLIRILGASLILHLQNRPFPVRVLPSSTRFLLLRPDPFSLLYPFLLQYSFTPLHTLAVTCNIQALFVNCVVDGMPEE